MIIKRIRLNIIITMIIYILLYNIVYSKILASSHMYSVVYPYKDVSLYWILLFTSIVLLPTIWLPKNAYKSTDLFLWIFYITAFIPSCYLSMYSELLSEYSFFVKIVFMGISFFIVHKIIEITSNFKIQLKLKFSLENKKITWLILLFFTIFSLLLLIIKFYRVMNLVDFSNVYDQRHIYSTLSVPRSFFSYTFNLLSDVILPFFIAYGICNYRLILVLFGIIGQICLYCIAATRITIASIFIFSFFVVLFNKYNKEISFLKCLWGLISLLVIITLLLLTIDNENIKLLFDLFFRRLLVAGNVSIVGYWSFFDSHPFTYLSQTFLNMFMKYPYYFSIPKEVGYFFFNMDCTANANYLAGAYANFGLFGMPIYSVILGGMLGIYNIISKNCPKGITYTVMLWEGYWFSSADLFTTLLTHGFILWIILIYLLVLKKPLFDNEVINESSK